jgi:hypothetical protein
VHEHGDVTVLRNQAVHTDREFTANSTDIIIKNKKKEKICILIDVAIPAERNSVQKEKEKNLKEFMYIDTTNVEHKIYDYTGSSWSHRNNSKGFMETFGIHTRKTFNGLATKDTYTWNITHNTESTAV